MSDPSPDFRHQTPAALGAILRDDPALDEKWRKLTSLARNDWICWTISPRKIATRAAHLKRLAEEVAAGKKRPCCGPGCPHRRASAQKWFKSPAPANS